VSDKSPQLEDGYIRIANELYDAILRHPFSKRELLVVLAVIRKTYGYGKKSDDMTMTQIAGATDLKLPHVSKTVRELGEKSVLLIRSGHYGKVLAISKHYRKWKKTLSAKKVTETVSDRNGNVTKTVITGYQNGHNGLPKRSLEVTKTVNTKDNPKRQLQKTTPKDKVAAAITAATWEAYCASYERRYGVPPTRNAKVNGQLAQFVKRIPAAEAPHVAAYYVAHNNGYYVRRGHSVDCLISDAEKLRTEWATNTKITEAGARRTDRTESIGQVWNKLLKEEGDGK